MPPKTFAMTLSERMTPPIWQDEPRISSPVGDCSFSTVTEKGASRSAAGVISSSDELPSSMLPSDSGSRTDGGSEVLSGVVAWRSAGLSPSPSAAYAAAGNAAAASMNASAAQVKRTSRRHPPRRNGWICFIQKTSCCNVSMIF